MGSDIFYLSPWQLGKQNLKKSDYTRNGQGTFYNEKVGPKLTINQKHCKFALLALARKLKLMTFSSKWENRFIYQVKEKNAFISVEMGGKKKFRPGGGKKCFSSNF